MNWIVIRFIIILICYYTLVIKKPSAEVSERQLERWGTDKQYKIWWKLMTMRKPLKKYKSSYNDGYSEWLIAGVIWCMFIGSLSITYDFIRLWI